MKIFIGSSTTTVVPPSWSTSMTSNIVLLVWMTAFSIEANPITIESFWPYAGHCFGGWGIAQLLHCLLWDCEQWPPFPPPTQPWPPLPDMLCDLCFTSLTSTFCEALPLCKFEHKCLLLIITSIFSTYWHCFGSFFEKLFLDSLVCIMG